MAGKEDEQSREDVALQAEAENAPESFATYSCPPMIEVTIKDRKDKVTVHEMGIIEAKALWGNLGKAIAEAEGL